MLPDTAARKTKKANGKPYKLMDTKGQYLKVRPTGSKLWQYRYRIAGKETVFAAGEYVAAFDGEIAEQAEAPSNGGWRNIAEGRVKREERSALVTCGIHPAHEHKPERVRQTKEGSNTFEAVLRDWIVTRHRAQSAKVTGCRKLKCACCRSSDFCG